MSVVTITRENFQKEVMESDKPVLLDFWAAWCRPCRMVSPIVDEIAQELTDHPFIRIHKSFLVRIDAVSHIDRTELRLILKSGVNLPISRRYYAQALERFIHYQLR